MYSNFCDYQTYLVYTFANHAKTVIIALSYDYLFTWFSQLVCFQPLVLGIMSQIKV